MPTGKASDLKTRKAVLAMFTNGKSFAKISEGTGLSKSGCWEIIKKFKESGDVRPRVRCTARPLQTKVTPEVMKNIEFLKTKTPGIYCREIRTKLVESGLCTEQNVPSRSLINRAVKQLGMSAKKIQVNPHEAQVNEVRDNAYFAEMMQSARMPQKRHTVGERLRTPTVPSNSSIPETTSPSEEDALMDNVQDQGDSVAGAPSSTPELKTVSSDPLQQEEWKHQLWGNISRCREAIQKQEEFCRLLGEKMLSTTTTPYLFQLEKSLLNLSLPRVTDGILYCTVFQMSDTYFIRYMESGIFKGYFRETGLEIARNCCGVSENDISWEQIFTEEDLRQHETIYSDNLKRKRKFHESKQKQKVREYGLKFRSLMKKNKTGVKPSYEKLLELAQTSTALNESNGFRLAGALLCVLKNDSKNQKGTPNSCRYQYCNTFGVLQARKQDIQKSMSDFQTSDVTTPVKSVTELVKPLPASVSWQQQLQYISQIPNYHYWQQKEVRHVSYSQMLSIIDKTGKYKPASARNRMLLAFRSGDINDLFKTFLMLLEPVHQSACERSTETVTTAASTDSQPEPSTSAAKCARKETRLTLDDLHGVPEAGTETVKTADIPTLSLKSVVPQTVDQMTRSYWTTQGVFESEGNSRYDPRTYTITLCVTIEQEIAIKTLYEMRGWPYPSLHGEELGISPQPKILSAWTPMSELPVSMTTHAVGHETPRDLRQNIDTNDTSNKHETPRGVQVDNNSKDVEDVTLDMECQDVETDNMASHKDSQSKRGVVRPRKVKVTVATPSARQEAKTEQVQTNKPCKPVQLTSAPTKLPKLAIKPSSAQPAISTQSRPSTSVLRTQKSSVMKAGSQHYVMGPKAKAPVAIQPRDGNHSAQSASSGSPWTIPSSAGSVCCNGKPVSTSPSMGQQLLRPTSTLGAMQQQQIGNSPYIYLLPSVPGNGSASVLSPSAPLILAPFGTPVIPTPVIPTPVIATTSASVIPVSAMESAVPLPTWTPVVPAPTIAPVASELDSHHGNMDTHVIPTPVIPRGTMESAVPLPTWTPVVPAPTIEQDVVRKLDSHHGNMDTPVIPTPVIPRGTMESAVPLPTWTPVVPAPTIAPVASELDSHHGNMDTHVIPTPVIPRGTMESAVPLPTRTPVVPAPTIEQDVLRKLDSHHGNMDTEECHLKLKEEPINPYPGEITTAQTGTEATVTQAVSGSHVARPVCVTRALTSEVIETFDSNRLKFMPQEMPQVAECPSVEPQRKAKVIVPTPDQRLETETQQTPVIKTFRPVKQTSTAMKPSSAQRTIGAQSNLSKPATGVMKRTAKTAVATRRGGRNPSAESVSSGLPEVQSSVDSVSGKGKTVSCSPSVSQQLFKKLCGLQQQQAGKPCGVPASTSAPVVPSSVSLPVVPTSVSTPVFPTSTSAKVVSKLDNLYDKTVLPVFLSPTVAPVLSKLDSHHGNMNTKDCQLKSKEEPINRYPGESITTAHTGTEATVTQSVSESHVARPVCVTRALTSEVIETFDSDSLKYMPQEVAQVAESLKEEPMEEKYKIEIANSSETDTCTSSLQIGESVGTFVPVEVKMETNEGLY